MSFSWRRSTFSENERGEAKEEEGSGGGEDGEKVEKVGKEMA
jgi:hypothetical protein